MNGKVTGTTDKYSDWATNTDNDLENEQVVWESTEASNAFHLEGLDEGTYYLKEIEAPAHYNHLKDEIEVIITSKKNQDDSATEGNGKTLYNHIDYSFNGVASPNVDKAAEANVVNQKGTELPGTGGMGTTLFYTAGGLVVAGAGLYLITSKRMKKDED